jgi:inorganic pyrophosphatase
MGYGEARKVPEEVTCMQVIEIGKGSKVKYELDKKSGLIKVKLKSLHETNTSYFWKIMTAEYAY